MSKDSQDIRRRYDWFERGQRLEKLGLHGPAAKAYEEAGALKSAEKMRRAAGMRFVPESLLAA